MKCITIVAVGVLQCIYNAFTMHLQLLLLFSILGRMKTADYHWDGWLNNKAALLKSSPCAMADSPVRPGPLKKDDPEVPGRCSTELRTCRIAEYVLRPTLTRHLMIVILSHNYIYIYRYIMFT